MNEQFHIGKGFRRFQLKMMGYMAILIGPIVLFDTMVIYGLPFPKSISETATIANKTAAILPFFLGALALFSLTYAIKHGYDRMDKIFTTGMFSGFTCVALQMCSSPYITDPSQVGVLGVTESLSGTIHRIGAITGFSCMMLWIMLCFTKSDKKDNEQTREKKLRNTCYFYLSTAMMLSLFLFLFNNIGVFGDNFPVVFVAECFILTFGGIACLIKGGLTLNDRKTCYISHSLVK